MKKFGPSYNSWIKSETKIRHQVRKEKRKIGMAEQKFERQYRVRKKFGFGSLAANFYHEK